MDEDDIELDDREGDSDAEAAQPASPAAPAAEQGAASHRNLEEALLLQMDMQKRLAEQLEVCTAAGRMARWALEDD